MSEELQGGIHTNSPIQQSGEIFPLDILIVLADNKKIVIGMPIVGAIFALLAGFIITPVFTSTTKIMPPQQQQSSGLSAMLGQIGGLAGAAGSIAGLKNPNDLYVGILESRTVADNLINRFSLKERYGVKNYDDVRKILNGVTDISNGKKDGLISISTDDEDPKFAADLANAYVEELAKLTQTMALTESSQRRLFFEKQLKEAKIDLSNAEVSLRVTQEKTGMIQPEGQVQAIIVNVAQIKGTIAAKEVELNAMRTYAAAQNPELLRLQEELRGLHDQLSKFEKKQSNKEGDLFIPTGKIPEAGIAYLRSLRDVKYYETVFDILAKQYELAKIDEAKESSLIQVLDKAVPTERKTKPRRFSLLLLGVFGGGIFGVLIAFANAAYRKSRKTPESNVRWEKLFSKLRE